MPVLVGGLKLPVSTVEYLRVQITGNTLLSGQSVQIAIVRTNSRPREDDWKPAAWVGIPDTTRTAAILVTEASIGTHDVWARVGGETEQPTLCAGTLTIF